MAIWQREARVVGVDAVHISPEFLYVVLMELEWHGKVLVALDQENVRFIIVELKRVLHLVWHLPAEPSLSFLLFFVRLSTLATKGAFHIVLRTRDFNALDSDVFRLVHEVVLPDGVIVDCDLLRVDATVVDIFTTCFPDLLSVLREELVSLELVEEELLELLFVPAFLLKVVIALF
jgi:hypothetical protein